MRLTGSGAADDNGVALIGDEGAVGKIPDQHLVDRRAVEVELRGGSVCLNSFRAVAKWIPASVRLPSGLMTAH